MSRPQRRGVLAGVLLACLLLAAIAIWSLRVPGESYRALVLVWLWAIPVLGAFGLAGWLLGAALGRFGGARSAAEHRGPRSGPETRA